VIVTGLLALPRDDFDSGDLGPLTQVDHPRGSVNVVVVEHRAAVDAGGDVAVDGAGSMAAQPPAANVPLVLATVVDPRTLLKRHVLHCKKHTQTVLAESASHHPGA